MIDIGWSEMAVVALVALLILGPKELPQAMRMAASWIKKARSVTREVQSGINDMIRDAEWCKAPSPAIWKRPSATLWTRRAA
jgi:sec-independent protein translocase protein TatB